MAEITEPTPRRIFRLTFTMADGTRHWRYVRCPYQVRGSADWVDSLAGMQTKLSEMMLKGQVNRFSVSAIAPERTRQAALRSHRWSEVLAQVAA